MAVQNEPQQPLLYKTKIRHNEPLAVNKFSWDLTYKILKAQFEEERPIVLLCIGTDRSTGDCLGPLVGSKFLAYKQRFFHVYGTLDQPVHATNLEENLANIYHKFQNPIIIAVDACLGQMDNVGTVNICCGSLQPGAGVKKSLPHVGDFNITGIVNVGGFMEYMVLQNTRLNLVMNLANFITEGLIATIREYNQTKAQEV